MKAQKKKRRGFTLVELMVVLAILGILAAIAIPKYNEVKYNASVDADVRTAEAIIHAARMEILLDEKLAGGSVADLAAVDVAAQLPYLETANPKVQSGATDGKFKIAYNATTDVITITFVTTKKVTLGGGAEGNNVTVTEGGSAVSAS